MRLADCLSACLGGLELELLVMAPLKHYRTMFGLFIASGLALGILSIHVHQAILALFFGNILFWGFLLQRVRCQNCGCPIAPPIGSNALTVLKSFSARKCRQCGEDLG